MRVFGDKFTPEQPRAATLERVIAGLRELGEHARGSGVAVILESHGDFTDSPTLLEIMKGAEMPTVGLLWDAHHTVVSGKETPAETFIRDHNDRLRDTAPLYNSIGNRCGKRLFFGTASLTLHDLIR